MKPKLLFLAKFFGISIALFAFGHQLLHGYASFLGHQMKIGNPGYRIPPNLEEFLYGSSMTIIAFFALILSTTNIRIAKKAGTLLAGTAAFFLTDYFFIRYAIFSRGHSALTKDSLAYEMYFCIKWLLPFLFWVLASYSVIGKIFNPAREGESHA